MASSEFILAIDNSLDFLNLAIAGDGRLIEERHARPFRPSSEILPLKVGALLADQGLVLSDLSLLVVSLGPGSFTGVRVALSYAKGVSCGLGIPLVGVATLDVLAWPFTGVTSGYVCPLVDARKGEAFFCIYLQEKDGLRRVTGYRCAGPREVVAELPRPCLVFGSGVGLCEQELARLEGVTIVTDRGERVMGEALIHLGLERQREGTTGILKPIYGRNSEAEIKLDVIVT